MTLVAQRCTLPFPALLYSARPGLLLSLSDAMSCLPPAAAPAPSPSPAQCCSDDALGCLFSYLALRDFAAAAGACRTWRHAALHPRCSPAYSATCRSESALESLQLSPLRRHVSSLRIASIVSASMLHALASSMTHLSELTVEVALMTQDHEAELDEWEHQPLGFPPALLKLTVEHASPGLWPLLLRSLSLSAPRLVSLTFTLPRGGSQIDLTPLLSLRSLQCLRVDVYGSISVMQLEVVKQISSLTDLSIDKGSLWSGELEQLCIMQPAHSLQRLTQMDFSNTSLTREIAGWLLQLPALTALSPMEIDLDAVAAGSGLVLPPRLTSLRVRIESRVSLGAEGVGGLVEALRSCRSLTSLSLSLASAPPLVTALRAIIDPLAAQLRSLRLEQVTLDDLACLEGLSAPLSALDELDLSRARTSDVSLHTDLRSLTPNLRRLMLPFSTLTDEEWQMLPARCTPSAMSTELAAWL